MSLNLKRFVLLSALFSSGILAAALLWNSIHLPFQNPLGVVGVLSRMGVNPQDDLLRFILVLILPGLLLVCFHRFIPGTPSRVSEAGMDGRADPGGPLVLLLIFAVLLALNVPTYHSFGRFDPYHEGESLGSAISHLSGEAPYRDYYFFHGLIQDPLKSAWAFHWFGRSIGAQRTWESGVKVLAWVFLALFLRRLLKGNLRAASALVLLAMVHVSFGFNVFYSSFLPSLGPGNIVDAFLRHRSLWEGLQLFILPARDVCTYSFLWAFLGVLEVLEGNKRPGRTARLARFFLFSFIPVAALGYSVDRGLYLTLVFLPLFLVLYFIFSRKSPDQADYLMGSASGVACALGAVGWMVKGNGLGFLKFVLITMPAYKELSEKLPFPLLKPKFMLACVLLAALLYLLVLEALNLRAAAKGKWLAVYAKERLVEGGLLFLSTLYFGNVLARSDEEHLFYSMGPLLILVLFIIMKFLGKWKRSGESSLLPARNLFLAFILLVGLLCVVRCVRMDLLEKNFPLRTPDSDFIPAADQAAVRFLSQKMKKGDLFFTFTSEAVWYYYLNQPCPTPFPYIWIAASKPLQEEIVGDLEMKKVKWILFKDDDWSYRIDGIPNDEKFPVVAAFIRSRYSFYKNVAGREFWVLKGG